MHDDYIAEKKILKNVVDTYKCERNSSTATAKMQVMISKHEQPSCSAVWL